MSGGRTELLWIPESPPVVSSNTRLPRNPSNISTALQRSAEPRLSRCSKKGLQQGLCGEPELLHTFPSCLSGL